MRNRFRSRSPCFTDYFDFGLDFASDFVGDFHCDFLEGILVGGRPVTIGFVAGTTGGSRPHPESEPSHGPGRASRDDIGGAMERVTEGDAATSTGPRSAATDPTTEKFGSPTPVIASRGSAQGPGAAKAEGPSAVAVPDTPINTKTPATSVAATQITRGSGGKPATFWCFRCRPMGLEIMASC